MKRSVPLITTAVYAAGLIAIIVGSHVVSAQDKHGEKKKKEKQPTVYNPYPFGILPPDLDSEIMRVQREVEFIEDQAIGEWHALPPPVVTGQPPTLQGRGYDRVRILGKLLNFDQNISPFRDIACSSCHMPYAGFGPPIPSVNLTMIGYPGTFHFRAGKRNPQRYTYSPDFPVLEYDAVQAAFFGGNFLGRTRDWL